MGFGHILCCQMFQEELFSRMVFARGERIFAYVLMLRLCQDKVSPLDGVTPSCCPRPLLQLATQCCARDPEERPSIAAVLEQLQGKVLRWIDSAAYSAGAGAQRPLTALEGWCDAADRAFLGAEPAEPEKELHC